MEGVQSFVENNDVFNDIKTNMKIAKTFRNKVSVAKVDVDTGTNEIRRDPETN